MVLWLSTRLLTSDRGFGSLRMLIFFSFPFYPLNKVSLKRSLEGCLAVQLEENELAKHIIIKESFQGVLVFKEYNLLATIMQKL